MKLFLCSNFKLLAPKFLLKYFDMKENRKCLFIGYADEEKDFYSESTVVFLKELGFDVVCLDENYNFQDDVDMIYVKGGNTTQLLRYLKEFNQFEKIKEMVKKGVLYAGASAGAIITGSDTEWTLLFEPYDFDMKSRFGKNAFLGFSFLKKLIFVHASKYRFPVTPEIEAAGRKDFRLSNEFFYKAYLKERKHTMGQPFIVLKDNEAFVKNGDLEKKVRIDWSKYPVLDEYRVF